MGGCLFILTPLCGYIFTCGCHWPWRGLHWACNFYDNKAIHRCPWCTSWFAGGFSFLFALIAALRTATTCRTKPKQYALMQTTVCYLLGMVLFVAIAVICGIVAAHLQNYPMGKDEIKSHLACAKIRLVFPSAIVINPSRITTLS
jgi:hypothetical protein